MELVEELIDDGDGEHIFGGERIQGAVVNIEAPGSVGLLDEENR